MKKYLSLLLALLVALSCTSLAFAAEEDEEEISPEMKELGEYIMNHQAEAFDLAVEGYTCQSEKGEAELLTDGTVNVTEYWTYSCRNFEKMTKFERTLAKSEDYEISDIRVVMGSEELERFNSYEEIQAATESEGEKYPERKLVVIDSLCSSSGYGLLVDGAADLRDAGKSMDEIAAEFEGKGYGDFKMAVAEVTADALAPVQAEYGKILADKAYVDEVLKSGAERASRLANRTVNKVYRKVGLLQLDK